MAEIPGPDPLKISSIAQTLDNPISMRNVPAFLNKLYGMVSDTSSDDLVHWGPDGTTFIGINKKIYSFKLIHSVVTHPERLAKEILPLYFKHSNFSSFVRQLNMYGFHKVAHLRDGSLATNTAKRHTGPEDGTHHGLDRMEFCHDYFRRGYPDLLQSVVRKRKTHTMQSIMVKKSSKRPEDVVSVTGLQGDTEDADYEISSSKPVPSTHQSIVRANAKPNESLAQAFRYLTHRVETLERQQQIEATERTQLQHMVRALWSYAFQAAQQHMYVQDVNDAAVQLCRLIVEALPDGAKEKEAIVGAFRSLAQRNEAAKALRADTLFSSATTHLPETTPTVPADVLTLNQALSMYNPTAMFPSASNINPPNRLLLQNEPHLEKQKSGVLNDPMIAGLSEMDLGEILQYLNQQGIDSTELLGAIQPRHQEATLEELPASTAPGTPSRDTPASLPSASLLSALDNDPINLTDVDHALNALPNWYNPPMSPLTGEPPLNVMTGSRHSSRPVSAGVSTRKNPSPWINNGISQAHPVPLLADYDRSRSTSTRPKDSDIHPSPTPATNHVQTQENTIKLKETEFDLNDILNLDSDDDS